MSPRAETAVSTHFFLASVLGVIALLASLLFAHFFLKKPKPSPTPPLPLRYPLSGFFLYIACILFASPIALLLLFFFFPTVQEPLLHLPLLATTLGQLFTLSITTVLLLLFVFLQPKHVVHTALFGPNAKASLRFALREWALGMALWLVVFPTAGFVYEIFDLAIYFLCGHFSPEQRALLFLQELKGSPYLLTIMLIAILLAAPFFEEIFFRAIFQNYLKKKMGFSWALLLSSATFSVLHLDPKQGWGNAPLAFALFTFALYLGWIYEKRRSLFAPIALHMTFNSINVMRVLLG